MQKNIKHNDVNHQDAVKKANDYITRLLKKRIWTGEETGKVYLYDFIRVTETHNSTQTKQHEQILKKTKDALNHHSFDKEKYKLYVHLFNWLLRTQSKAVSFANSFISSSKDICYIVKVACSAELILQELEKQSSLELSNIQPHLQKLTIDKFIEISNKTYANEINHIKRVFQKITTTWKEIALFSKTLEEIGNIINIKEMIVFEGNLENGIKQLIEELHKEILNLREIIANGNYKNDIEKEQKLKIIDEVFIKANILNLPTRQVNINEKESLFEGIRIAKKINPKF
jgi:hypothetical protein